MVILKSGTTVKIGGFPFVLMQDTRVEGDERNIALVEEIQSGENTTTYTDTTGSYIRPM